ncbi:dihydroneopterin aldolase [Sphingomonas sinipercae]|uniref:Dihydroneopterin aldolase n=1 Tax=Sphingomonas sinipercae TaxID=2714944 RepID=A0A6G7ZMV7_9SPHN|nr:dihydroneopterin aldolase [Sphingomonas sinipercae]QIL02327.1 dihydroneopterin aldolase [Sphingomonas sinipercae]
MVPLHLLPKQARIIVEDLEIQADIGFHPFEIGSPQRLLVTVEVLLDHATPPADDDPANAWDYDFVREQVIALAVQRRHNLQETLAYNIYLGLAGLRGVRALRVRTAKPDVYPDTRAVGVEYSSLP